MYIKNIKIKNFKSIEETKIDFSPLTMFVGGNASGKSNIINAFRFIQNIITYGIDNAIALQGGIQYIANANLPKGEKIEISFTIDVSNEMWLRHLQNRKFALEVEEIDYSFAIQPNKRGLGYHIAYDFIKSGKFTIGDLILFEHCFWFLTELPGAISGILSKYKQIHNLL